MTSIFLDEDLQGLAKWLKDNNFGGCTVLVTGSTGLIGSLCIKAMARYNALFDDKITICAMARNEEKIHEILKEELPDKNVNILIQDIYQPILTNLKIDYVIHAASPTSSKFMISNPVETLDAIYVGTRNVLDYARQQKVKAMVYLSSMEVFGQVDTLERIDERQLGYIDLKNIRSCYPEGKRVAELLCKCYSSEYGLSIKIARLAQIFGAGVSRNEGRVFSQFARSAIAGKDIILHTNGISQGNYCYTADAVRGIFLLLKSGVSGETYTVVNEANTCTIAEMADMVAREFSGGKSKVIYDIPAENIFGYASDTKMRLSSQKICKLGWKPQYGLKQMYERMLPDLMESYNAQEN